MKLGTTLSAAISKLVAPFTGAWIETYLLHQHAISDYKSPPSRGRGLKHGHGGYMGEGQAGRPRHGGVD